MGNTKFWTKFLYGARGALLYEAIPWFRYFHEGGLSPLKVHAPLYLIGELFYIASAGYFAAKNGNNWFICFYTGATFWGLLSAIGKSVGASP